MEHLINLPLILTPQSEGGYMVTSPLLPEFITEGDTLDEALRNVQDAIKATIEIYQDLKKPLPQSLFFKVENNPMKII